MKKTITAMTAVCCVAAALFLISCRINQNQTSSAGEASLVRTIKIGSPVFAPYFYVGEDGNYTGADKEIAEEAFRRIGCEAVFEDIIWGEKDRLLDSKEIDCIWGCFVMDGRENRYQWAGPYLTSEEAVVVSKDSDITSIDDLNGRTVAVRIDSKAEEFFLGKISDQAPVPETLATFNSMKEAFVWFGKGYADAVVDHRAALIERTKEHPDLYRFLDDTLFTANLGVAFRTDFDSELVSALTDALKEMNEDGTISQIEKTYHVGTDTEEGSNDES